MQHHAIARYERANQRLALQRLLSQMKMMILENATIVVKSVSEEC